MITFPLFKTTFTNEFKIEKILPTPSQEEIKAEKVAFSWCPLEEAIKVADRHTKLVLENMLPLLKHNKKYILVDSKIQFFQKVDAPVDSLHWHVDGSISVEDERTKKLGYILLHDMYARMQHKSPPTFLAYQSSTHCATQYLDKPLEVTIPKCIPSFSIIDDEVNAQSPRIVSQQPGSIVSFNGWSIHRAVRASESGWRLWVRVKETDHFTESKQNSIDSYGTIFRN